MHASDTYNIIRKYIVVWLSKQFTPKFGFNILGCGSLKISLRHFRHNQQSPGTLTLVATAYLYHNGELNTGAVVCLS